MESLGCHGLNRAQNSNDTKHESKCWGRNACTHFEERSHGKASADTIGKRGFTQKQE